MQGTWSGAEPYEAYVGRSSRKLAPAFVAWAGVPRGARVVDVGCGTGALSTALLASEPASLLGVDLSSAYIEEARRRLPDPRARFEVGDATTLPLAPGSVDAALSGLVLNFVPQPIRMLREMQRVLVPGGLAAVYVWDYAGRMEMIRHFWDAAVALDPRAHDLDEGVRFPVCRPDALRQLFQESGFVDVDARGLDLATRFSSFDELWRPFLGAQGPAGSYVASLDEKGREALREELRARLPVQPDGSIPLVARAWAAKGYSSAIS